MSARRNYRLMAPANLAKSYRWWGSHLDELAAHAIQFGDTRSLRRSRRRTLRNLRLIAAAARKRGVRL
jgi:hypothetical protein